MAELIKVKDEDFLDEDPPLRGQNYTVLSFLSPEEVIKRKDVFMFEKFLGHFSKEMTELFAGMSQKYPDDIDRFKVIQDRYSYVFKADHLQEELQTYIGGNPDLDREYHEKNNFQTSIRGIKVRGVFDTQREAEIRAQVLKKIDNKFNVYVANVGCWCPWSPNPDEISDQEYAESGLNTLMKKYKDNQDKRDIFYEERKDELRVLKMKEKMAAEDPWLKSKAEASAPEDLPETEDKTEQEPIIAQE